MSSSTVAPPRPAHPWLPPWVPRRPPDKWNVTHVVNHSKTAMLIELTTIPLYLYAAYSIEPSSYIDVNANEGNKDVIDAKTYIITVAIQEMLHLTLSGNLLCALDGFMELYDYRIIPQFPGTILYEKVEMNLNRANQENLRDFEAIEAPAPDGCCPPVDSGEPNTTTLAPDYQSIGCFYHELQKGLKTLSEDHLNHNPDYQFSTHDFSHPPFDAVVVIRNQEIAQNALELIIEQGEGGSEIKQGNSHYCIFKTLADSADLPPWKMYDVPTNPKTSDYEGLGCPKNFAYKLSLAFDAAFCYLLQNIQRVWGRGGGGAFLHNHLVGNMLGIMKCVMPPLAGILLQQQLDLPNLKLIPSPPKLIGIPPPSRPRVAAPCFDCYPPKVDNEDWTPLEPEDLHVELLNLVYEAVALALADIDHLPPTNMDHHPPTKIEHCPPTSIDHRPPTNIDPRHRILAEVKQLQDIATEIKKLTPYP